MRTHDDEYVTSCSNSYGELQENYKGYKWIAFGYQVNLHDHITSALCFSARLNDSSLEELGDHSNLNNYLPDSTRQ